jgi:hypothetical protein
MYDLLGGADDTTLETKDTALVTMLNAWGLNVILGTLTPCHGYSPCTATIDDVNGGGYRGSVNTFLMDNFSNTYLTPYADAVDLDQTVASIDANGFEILATGTDAGDHINLTAAGTQDLLGAQDGNDTALTDLLASIE